MVDCIAGDVNKLVKIRFMEDFKYIQFNEIDREKLIEDAKRANERLEEKMKKKEE